MVHSIHLLHRRRGGPDPVVGYHTALYSKGKVVFTYVLYATKGALLPLCRVVCAPGITLCASSQDNIEVTVAVVDF